MIDRIRGDLAAAGHAWMRPRAAVLRVLVSTSSPVTAEKIPARLRAVPGGERVNLSALGASSGLERSGFIAATSSARRAAGSSPLRAARSTAPSWT